MEELKNVDEWTEYAHQMTESKKRKERWKIMRSIIFISVGFFFNFVAFTGLATLQSTLHIDEGMGVINQAILYGIWVSTCLFLPKVIIGFLKYKWTITTMFVSFLVWLASNGYGVWWTMTPASIIVGLCAAPLWTAQSSYFTIAAKRYAILNGEKVEHVLPRFFGMFTCIYQLNVVVGAIISSSILEPTFINGTEFQITDDILKFCGALDCPGNNVTNLNLEEPDSLLVWIIVGVYLGCAVLGIILLILLVDKLPNVGLEQNSQGSFHKKIVVPFLATMYHLRHNDQLLLLPLTMFLGLKQGFIEGDFNKSFVSCSVGIRYVGWVSIAYGAASASVSFIIGILSKKTGRIPLFAAAFTLQLSIQIVLLLWMPHPDQTYLLFLFSGLWGVSDGVWRTLTSALYGSLFGKDSDAAFCLYGMWISVGVIVMFSISSVVCTAIKLYVLVGFLVLGLCGYIMVEMRHCSTSTTNVHIQQDATMPDEQEMQQLHE